MTSINWEGMNGEQVEQVACALIMLDNPAANESLLHAATKGSTSG